MFSGFGFGNTGSVPIPQEFEDFFRCYPIAMMNDRIRKDDANFGGKIFLPPSALNRLSMLNIRYPMLFRLTSNESGKVTHGGVLEFIAEEGRVYLPQWMMETLNAQPGSLMKINSTDVPLGQFVKIEPQSTDFLDITDPKAVLENVLRNFSTLTIDDIIEISYNNKTYRIKVLEVKPESAAKSICVIETDLVTDFAPPVGYVEPDYKALKAEQDAKRKSAAIDPVKHSQGSMATRIKYSNILNSTDSETIRFAGEGQKISGKPNKTSKGKQDISEIKISLDSEPARLDLPEGQLFFGFPLVLPKDENAEEEENDKKVFIGEGQSLRKSKKSKK
ncbi:Ubiquitin fusion degradation protein 1 [Nakaseomyces glabratus]|uniref:Ubiquitin fusion degradation protein 1 n=1 Tax=Candida glabrata TaxID=5478 RepID=A0A0W0E794_CANGB|nr:Ubiquitin fusion degradation protein UFD1 [Nakaseomyces glabratus]KAH7597902.1 Ubiquitin fusion degradation protein UFD1 [Nakaseomyces glabratus]KAH7612196.1 Ubiquitin fusion degradation protein UFD1 [Nakaseomyces glabratus]KTA98305.1 Ubiquitin fusion degradation protein 1 [Nakaseomyces glabratus]KTB09052.1 Ubiquitin fusion degradation protein 1 [Nakaseomyces glabratus]